MPFVDVAVNSGLPHRQAFSYAVPPGITLGPGDAVFVPFGRRVLQGIVMQTVDVASFAEPKEVDARLGDAPVVTAERIELARWLAGYYLAPLFASVALMLPPGFERKPLTFYESLLDAHELDSTRLPPKQRLVIAYLTENGRCESRELDREIKETGVATALSQLVQRGLIRRTYGLDRPSVKAKTVRHIRLTASSLDVETAIAELTGARKGRLAKALQLLLDEGPALPASELRQRSGAGPTMLQPLIDERLVELVDEPVERDPLAGRRYRYRAASPLTPEQTRAFQPIGEALNERASNAGARGKSFLLHGVTGSGKTEVYLQALEHAIALGKRAIVLVPEIALTPQTVRRFAERFPGEVAVLHSGLTQGELFDQWHGIAQGRYAVVIGSRSAVFAPQPDLGLIVIDEEHEWTYKQNDPAPRYHAREAALQLADLLGTVVVLGSATPDVVSYQKALWGQHELLELRERVRPVRVANAATVGAEIASSGDEDPHPSPLPGREREPISQDSVALDQAQTMLFAETPSAPTPDSRLPAPRIVTSLALPPVEVVDMREELKGGNRSIFSRALQLGLYQTIERGEQVILFLNRRGAAGFMQCRDCGFVPQCSACAIPLGFHRQGGTERMLCHQCNRSRRPFERCPMCGSPRLRPMGLGVEAVEEAVVELLPGARTLRWDRDVTQGKHAHEQILQSFLKGEAEVLIGTQMVAKGLDLPSVTLVGVVSADIGLHIPDFRSAERTFQLLTQVAGRAGRTADEDGGPQRGSVVIQTYTPDNYAILAAAQHDYHAFFEHEMELRQAEAYPPYVRLARLVYSHTNPERGEREATRLVRLLRETSAREGLPGVEVLGPAPPHVPKWHGRTRWQITVRSPDPRELLAPLTLGEGWVMDIDPASLA